MDLISEETETGKRELSVEEMKAMWLCPKCRQRKWKDRSECFGCIPPSEEEIEWKGKAVNESRHRSWLLKFGWKDPRAVELQEKRRFDRQGGAWVAAKMLYTDRTVLHNGAYQK